MTRPDIDKLVIESDSKIILLVMDGLGGLPRVPGGMTELETAHTPNLDALAANSSCGLLEPVGAGITPGSGPGHLAMFGYDPVKYDVGRGLLESFGIDFPLGPGDLAARCNFASLDNAGNITDRRAGRISTERNSELCQNLAGRLDIGAGVEVIVTPVKEHRALLVVRGEGLSDALEDTDPQATGVPPKAVNTTSPEAKPTAGIAQKVLDRVKEVLADETPPLCLLARGWSLYRKLPGYEERFGLKAYAIAGYPMYRGLAKLVGMEVHPFYKDYADAVAILNEKYADYDFFYLHIKKTDSYGEDGNFDARVNEMEKVDAEVVPAVIEMKPDVLVVTGDHSTPAVLKSHSWHPVPVILSSRYARGDAVDKFGETACLAGALGIRPMTDILPLALACAGRLTKYGA